MKDEYIVSCNYLTKMYGDKMALADVNLKLGKGKIIGLLGPNGSGKTTLIKIINGLIQPSAGSVLIDGEKPGKYTKRVISYLPDRNFFADWMKVKDMFDIFEDFYDNFDRKRASEMCKALNISESDQIKSMSKGMKEKVQLILVMSRDADLYLLDEPIAGVDPAARDYILNTIINSYNEEGTILISTHLIADIERILDEVVFIKEGEILLHKAIDDIKEEQGQSVDSYFRDIFKMDVYNGREAQ